MMLKNQLQFELVYYNIVKSDYVTKYIQTNFLELSLNKYSVIVT